MARYYDMDKLADMIRAKADTLIEGKVAFGSVAKWLELLPSADVAPKSEVAREIFAEIEAAVNYCIEEECSKDFGFVSRAWFNVKKFKTKLSELKKKYTEGAK